MIRVLYAGSPESSKTMLELLLQKESEYNFKIVGILTNPPSAKGRHKTPVPTDVAQCAAKKGIPVFAPEHLNAEARNAVASVHPDILVCFAYGHIFGPKFMSLFTFGGINLHPSALPKYRGCTPVNAAILNGDTETAYTIQKISEKMDEGNILEQEKITLSGRETAFSLLHDAAIRGVSLICTALSKINKNGFIEEGIPQSGTASYTGMISKQDAFIDWSKSGTQIDREVRAYFQDPISWTLLNGETLKILDGMPAENGSSSLPQELLDGSADTIAPGTVCAFSKKDGIFVKCGEGFYIIKKLQRQGKAQMDSSAFMNGMHNFIGTKLG
ncbi:MAG: methionyl-tRNA formyltransferase [Treponema sp.]|nr:methionyl-tRNA formyltransferase [Treponema sp.]MBD5406970.1 methionyl-tRNA formyltransferase [Treponema sp.]